MPVNTLQHACRVIRMAPAAAVADAAAGAAAAAAAAAGLGSDEICWWCSFCC